MRRFDRSLNLDLFDDQWLWLQNTEPLTEEIPPWTDEEILYLCDRLLEDSLRNMFDGRCSMETMVDIHNWVMKLDDPYPFSFNNCCKVAGLDPEEIRETVLSRFKSPPRQPH